MNQLQESEIETSKENPIWAAIKETASLLLMAVVLAWIIYTFIVQTFWIPTGSMERTIMPGDRVLVAKFYYRFWKPLPGDIFVFKSPEKIGESEPDLIKRVVATSGMIVEEKDGQLYINNKLQDEPYILPDRPDANFGPYKVPKGTLFAMGDNRSNSKDSRWIGPIKKDAVIGRAFFTYWPPQRFGMLR